MTTITVEHVSKKFELRDNEIVQAVDDVSLKISEGGSIAIIGPSGCGKTTLLRMIAGLEEISDGTVAIGDTVVNKVAASKRGVAMVFQTYALYPHMTVKENMGFGLKMNGHPKAVIEEKVAEATRILKLEEYLSRKPAALSGGQRQRVSIGRAIVRGPEVFLFDEPLSNLDAALRVHMRKEIRALHDRLKATFVYVTHDQIEAMTMADHVVVMREGVIEQQGAPLELYDTPANKFVAGFIGSPAMNFLPGTMGPDGNTVKLAIEGGAVLPLARSLEPGRTVTVGLRPEHLRLDQQNPAIRVPVSFVESTGSTTFYTAGTEPELNFVAQGRENVSAGDVVGLQIDPANIHLFDTDSGATL